MPTFTWTAENIELMKQLIDDKLVAREIGDILGTSKSAVIAKCKRIGLKLGDNNSRGTTPIPTPIILLPAIPATAIKNILDLKDHHCRYPYNDVGSPDFFFCGADVKQDKPYCETHCRQAYRPYEKQPFKEPTSKSYFNFKRS